MSKVQLYKDAERRWRWRFLATNGRILADGSQSYSRRIDALTGCVTVLGGDLLSSGGVDRLYRERGPDVDPDIIPVRDLTKPEESS